MLTTGDLVAWDFRAEHPLRKYYVIAVHAVLELHDSEQDTAFI